MILPSENNKKAFTLIELLIVVSIIIIITGAALPAFSSYLRNQTLFQAKEQLKNDLRSIQNKSLTGEKSETVISAGGNATSDLTGRFWVVKITPDIGTYHVYSDLEFINYDNPTGRSTRCNGYNPSDSRYEGKFDLPDGAVLNLGGAVQCLFFDMDTGKILSSSNAYTGSIQVVYNSQTKNVSWNYAGMIGNGSD